MLAQAANQVDVAPQGLLMLALAAEQFEAAQDEEEKENKAPETPPAGGLKWMRDPEAGPLRVCFMPFTLSCNCI